MRQGAIAKESEIGLPAVSAARSRRRVGATLALVIAVAVGHWSISYRPRQRAAVPRWADAPARLLADDSWDVRVWVAYPHQNLSGDFVAGGADDLPSFLPSFGPFRLPPARELAVAWQSGKEAPTVPFRAAVRVYPGLARFARLAGAVAGNAWLGGGTVLAGGRRGWVAWSGSLWTFGSEQARAAPGAPVAPAPRPTLYRPEALVAAFAARGGRLDFLGAGPFGVSRLGDDWLIRDLARSPRASPPEMRLALALEGLSTDAGEIAERDQRGEVAILVLRSAGSGWQVLALLGPRPPRSGAGHIVAVPSAVALSSGVLSSGVLSSGALSSGSGAAGRFSLPGEKLLSRLGVELGSEVLGDWQAVWSDRRGEELGRRLQPRLERLPSPAEIEDGQWAAHIEPATVAALAQELVGGLDRLPLRVIPRLSDGLDWRLIGAVASRLEGSRRLVVEGRPGAVRITSAPDFAPDFD